MGDYFLCSVFIEIEHRAIHTINRANTLLFTSTNPSDIESDTSLLSDLPSLYEVTTPRRRQAIRAAEDTPVSGTVPKLVQRTK